MKLYVGNLLHAVNEQQLKTLFEPYGEIVSVKVIKDKMTGGSKGFGFVEYTTEEASDAAMEALNGKPFEGRTLRIDKARPQEPKPMQPRRFSNNGGGSNGGYRNNGFGR